MKVKEIATIAGTAVAGAAVYHGIRFLISKRPRKSNVKPANSEAQPAQANAQPVNN